MKKILLAFAFFPAVSFAITGNELHKLLNSENIEDRISAAMYMQGLSDAETHFRELEILRAEKENRAPARTIFFCPPSEATLGQVMDVVKIHFEKHPENRHHSAPVPARQALLNTWRCK